MCCQTKLIFFCICMFSDTVYCKKYVIYSKSLFMHTYLYLYLWCFSFETTDNDFYILMCGGSLQFLRDTHLSDIL